MKYKSKWAIVPLLFSIYPNLVSIFVVVFFGLCKKKPKCSGIRMVIFECLNKCVCLDSSVYFTSFTRQNMFFCLTIFIKPVMKLLLQLDMFKVVFYLFFFLFF